MMYRSNGKVILPSEDGKTASRLYEDVKARIPQRYRRTYQFGVLVRHLLFLNADIRDGRMPEPHDHAEWVEAIVAEFKMSRLACGGEHWRY